MPRKRHTAEEIVTKLRQVGVLTSQGQPVAESVRTIGVTEVTYYRWRPEYGGLKGDQVKRLKELESENKQLRRGVSDLTLEKLILKEAASGNWYAPPAAVPAWIMSLPSTVSPRPCVPGSWSASIHTAQGSDDPE
jgi:transposase-like protein